MNALRLLLAAKTSIVRTVPLMRDARVPIALKTITGVAAIAILSPLDLFGDIPVLGVLDDAALLSLLCWAFVRFASRHVERETVALSPAIRASV